MHDPIGFMEALSLGTRDNPYAWPKGKNAGKVRIHYRYLGGLEGGIVSRGRLADGATQFRFYLDRNLFRELRSDFLTVDVPVCGATILKLGAFQGHPQVSAIVATVVAEARSHFGTIVFPKDQSRLWE